ncbi:MAG: hypothetical protein FJ137_11305 [Deltaproteobacteria bacterium]|nr:hypothetical protein [Deltaproteobacteria bacterium]
MLHDVTPAPDTPFNDWDIVATSAWPAWVHALAVVAVVFALALSWTSTRGAPLRLRLGLLSLRAVLGALLVCLLLQPGRRLLATSRQPDRVVVAVDTSASMAVGEGNQQRVRRAATAALAVIDDVTQREPPFAPEVWLFDDTLKKAGVDDLRALADGARPAQGPATRVALPLEAVIEADGGARAPLGGVVVVSDGGDTTGLPVALTTDLRERAARLGGSDPPAPLHAVVVGADASFQDVVVDRVVADEFAFVRNPMTVEVTLRQRGYGDQAVPVTLAEDGVLVAKNEVSFAGEATVKTTFTLTPQRSGKHLYTVQAAVLAGEAIAENNRADFTVKLIRDRIRVLQVTGRPSWDERFVRRLLKENPSVDLISFFILRSTTDISGAHNSEMSLIPFPTRELFTEQLGTFDVVIFQDFNYRPYQMGIYLQNVADYVKNGGGFLMLGGDLSFSEGDYDGSPVADVLPIRLRPGHGHTDVEDFVPVVTDAGRRHPVTDIGGVVDTGAGNGNPFAALPPLQGLNLSAGLQPDAVALLTHPAQNDDNGASQPVIAVRDVGRGRSVAITTDTLWHWALPQAANGRGSPSDAHRRLLANTLRWLIRDPELSHVKLTLDAPGDIARGVEPGAPVTAEIRAFDARYDAEPGAKVRLTLQPLDTAGARQAPVVVQGETGADGTFRAPLHPQGPGAWRVRVEVEKAGQAIGFDEDVFVVRAASLERLYGEARPELLAALAAAGGGQAVDVDDVEGLPFVDHGRVRVHRQKTEPLWNRPAALALVALIAAVEWWWRRRRGFA